MAWIEKKPKSYLVRWKEPGTRKTVSRSFKWREDARRFKTEVERKIDTREYVDKATRQTTLGDYFEDLVADTNIRPSTRYAQARTFDKHVAPVLGHRPMADISTSELRSLLARLDAGDSAKRNVYKVLAKCFNAAVREGLIPRSPLSALPRPKVEREPIRPLTIEELKLINFAAAERYRTPIAVAAFTGLRAGEIGGLQVEDINFLRRRITVRRASVREGGKRVISNTKTNASQRTIPVPAWIIESIAEYMKVYEPVDGYVFTTPTGRPMTHNELNEAFHEAVVRAGVHADKHQGTWRKPRFHDLRHTCAALLIEQGLHPKQIQAHLGHSSITVTFDTYGHLFPSMEERVVEGLEAAWKEAR